MASDDVVPPADQADSRRELEKVAFARPGSPADEAAAADALRELVAMDEAALPIDPPVVDEAVSPEVPVRQGPDSSADPPMDPAAASETPGDAAKPEASRRRRSLVPLIVLAGLAVGVASGLGFARAAPTVLASPISTPAPATGVESSFGFTPIGPQYASASAATAALKAKQSAADVFPLPSFTKTLDVEPASIHRILTTNDGLTLWIGRTSEDICLLFSGPDATSSLDAGSNCATPSEFGTDGLTLSDGKDQWSWNGVDFTTTVTN